VKTQLIETNIGKIAVHITEGNPQATPIIFLHGVYYDSNLWKNQVSQIKDRTIITLDMPFHGDSKAVRNDWNMDDCATMLVEVLDGLNINEIVAVGHSWGSMTILRAAAKAPNRFAAIWLFVICLSRKELGKQNCSLECNIYLLDFRVFLR